MRAMTPRVLLPVAVIATMACVVGGTATVRQADADVKPIFSFVVLADPHIDGSPGPDDRLRACTRWINDNRHTYGIELVLVPGDLGGAIEHARDLLDRIDVPWVPVIGDNNVQAGRAAAFEAALSRHYERLARRFENWRKAPTPVKDPRSGRELHLVNLSFDHKGVHFIGLDWCTRTKGRIRGEQADLFPFPGGTLPFLEEDLERCPKTRRENVVLFAHHPMHSLLFGAASFSPREIARIHAATRPYRDHVYAAFGGHYHLSMQERENSGGFEVFVTDATHEDGNTLRLVRVYDDGKKLSYVHRLVGVPTRVQIDLATLAARAHPTGPGKDPTASFRDLRDLRDAPRPAAVSALARVVQDHAGTSRIHRYAAGQALSVIGTPEAREALEAEGARADFDGRLAFDYAFHWRMAPSVRDAYLADHVLQGAGEAPTLTLRALPPREGEKTLRFEITFENRLDRCIELGSLPPGEGKWLVFRAVEGHVARTLWPYGCQGLISESVAFEAGAKHTLTAVVEILAPDAMPDLQGYGVTVPGSVGGKCGGWHYLLGEPGTYEVVAFFTGREGRCVSAPVRVEVPAP
jgi:hypothetical protein